MFCCCQISPIYNMQTLIFLFRWSTSYPAKLPWTWRCVLGITWCWSSSSSPPSTRPRTANERERQARQPLHPHRDLLTQPQPQLRLLAEPHLNEAVQLRQRRRRRLHRFRRRARRQMRHRMRRKKVRRPQTTDQSWTPERWRKRAKI